MYEDPITTDNAIAHHLSKYLYQAVLSIWQQHPDRLRERYRQLAWENGYVADKIVARFRQKLEPSSEPKHLARQCQEILHKLAVEDFMQSPWYRHLMASIEDMLAAEVQVKSGLGAMEAVEAVEAVKVLEAAEVLAETDAIAILLLDAENMQVDAETEQFLAGLCEHPIQIKIAFANWRNLGKHDIELHERGYELIHVPPGKNSADVKMATVGSSIFVHYPKAREVFVCSCDGVLTHLCNTLKTHGLSVYRVRKYRDTIEVTDTQTGDRKTHTLQTVPHLPEPKEFVEQLRQILRQQQQKNESPWISLTALARSYESCHDLSLEEVLADRFDGRDIEVFFRDRPADFALHHPSQETEAYVTAFESPLANGSSSFASWQGRQDLRSSAELEAALRDLIKQICARDGSDAVATAQLGSEFRKIYGKKLNLVVQELALGEKVSEFLLSRPCFSLVPANNSYEVKIISNTRESDRSSAKNNARNGAKGDAKTIDGAIASRAQLERALVKLARELMAAPNARVSLAQLGKVFCHRYNQPITKVLKDLGLNKRLPTFVQSCHAFRLHRNDNYYEISLVPEATSP